MVSFLLHQLSPTRHRHLATRLIQVPQQEPPLGRAQQASRS